MRSDWLFGILRLSRHWRLTENCSAEDRWIVGFLGHIGHFNNLNVELLVVFNGLKLVQRGIINIWFATWDSIGVISHIKDPSPSFT